MMAHDAEPPGDPDDIVKFQLRLPRKVRDYYQARGQRTRSSMNTLMVNLLTLAYREHEDERAAERRAARKATP